MNILWLGPLAAFLSSVTWAIGSANYSKIAAKSSPFTVNFTRAAFALPCFLVASLFESHGFTGLAAQFAKITFPQVGWLSLSMFSSYAFGDTLFLLSARSLGVPGALAISSIFPIWTALLAFFSYGEALAKLQGAGLLIAVGGVITVIMNEPRSHGVPIARERRSTERSVKKGVLIAFACSLFWCLNSYSISRGGIGTDAFVGNAVRMMLALPLTCLISAAFGPRLLGRDRSRMQLLLPLRDLKTYWWVFLIETFAGSYFYFYGLSHSRLALGSTLTSLAPVLSVPVALALKIERFSLARTAGVCLVVIGLCLLMGGG